MKSFLNLIEIPLNKKKMKFRRLDGSMQIKARNAALEVHPFIPIIILTYFLQVFKKSKDINIMLMSLKAGGLGLNLVEVWHKYCAVRSINKLGRRTTCI